jgi:hypothetical protein
MGSVGGLLGASEERAKRPWVDPTHTVELAEELESMDAGELERSVSELVRCGVLVIECIDGRVQTAAAASVVRNLPIQGLVIVQGHVTDRAANDLETYDTDEQRSSWGARWTARDIVNPKLAQGRSCVLLLEVSGASGQALLDEIFRTSGTFNDLCSKLRQERRFLLLMPVARAGMTLNRGHAVRGFSVHTLKLDFLPYWLEFQFRQEAHECLELIRQRHADGEWSHSEEVLYESLSALARQRATGTLLQRLEKNRGAPRVLATVEQALADASGESETLLAAAFVAAYLPGLTQRDFDTAVEAVLAGRSRWKPRVPSLDGDRLRPARSVEVTLRDEWRAGLRFIMQRAELEVKPDAAGGKVVGFRDDRARPLVKDELARTPLFVMEQMERLARAGLLFSRGEALSAAIAGAVTEAVQTEPETYDLDWLMLLLGPALAPEPAAMEAQLAQVAGAHRVLRRLLEAATDATRDAGASDTIVDACFERALRLDQERAGQSIPDLALRLRDAPAFDYWYWLRQVFDCGKAAARERARSLLRRIPHERESNFETDVRQILGWLPVGVTGGPAVAAVAELLHYWMGESIRFCAGQQTAASRGVADFLRRLASGPSLLPELAAALFHPAVLAAATPDDPDLAWKTAAVLLPPAARASGLQVPQEVLLLVMIPAWNGTVADLLDDVDGAVLAQQLAPALALAAWCEVFPDALETMRAVAERLFQGLKHDARLAVRIWFSAFIAALDQLETAIVERPELGDAAGDALLRAAVERRRRFERFREQLTQPSPVVESS